MTSILENHLVRKPQAAALYRSTDRRHLPDLAEHISSALEAGCYTAGFQNLARGNVKYVPRRKEDPENSGSRS